MYMKQQSFDDSNTQMLDESVLNCQKGDPEGFKIALSLVKKMIT